MVAAAGGFASFRAGTEDFGHADRGVFAGASTGTPTAYARLRVRNEPGRRTAKQVEALIAQMRWFSPDEGRFHNVPPAVERHVDLVYVRQDNPQDLLVSVSPLPLDGRHVLPDGRYELDLVLASRNADARRYTIGIDFDGKWSTNVPDHLSVRIIRLPAS